MKSAALGAGLLALVAIPAWAGSIGLFATPDCSSCNLDVPQGTLGTFYVQAVPGRFTPLTGAEFRIAGLPPEWLIAAITPNPQVNLLVGNPLGAGCNLGFYSAQPGQCVNLLTVQVFATTPVANAVLQITRHDTPSNPLFQCPALVWACLASQGSASEACFTQVCAAGGSMFLNSSVACTVAAQPVTWARLKDLYR